MSSQSLFLFTVGPVQSFILQSRKTKDLYAGSFLLSYLMKCALEVLEKEKNVEIIFPAVNSGNINSIPNRLIAKVQNYSSVEKEELGRKLSAGVQKKFFSIWHDEILMKLPESLKGREQFRRQMADFLETYWIFQDFQEYLEGYKKILQRLHEIKNIRIFQQTEEESGKKCTVNSEKNIVVYRKENDRKYPAFLEKENLILLDTNSYGFALAEGLCAPVAVKRLLGVSSSLKELYNDKFPSLSKIALCSKSLSDEFDNIYDYSDDICEAVLSPSYSNAVLSELSSQDAEKVKEIAEDYRNRKVKTSPYYAVVKFDGDNMGEIYAPTNLKSGKDYEVFHRELSNQLCLFAQFVADDVKPEEGRVVYAGGEDFLGFFSLDALEKVIKRFRKRFSEIISVGKFTDKKITFSAGITVAHAKYPLKRAMELVEAAENYAKDIDEDKNAFAVSVVTRSGKVCRFRNKFDKEDNDLFGWKNFFRIVSFLKKSEVSRSFLVNISDVLRCLCMEPRRCEDKDFLTYVVKNEIVRTLSRSSIREDMTDIVNEILDLYNSCETLKDFLQALYIVRFLSKGGEV